MWQRRLRSKPRINYLELDEPSFDTYVYCEKCRDHVYEYCSIHGPLLVIPDDKVSSKDYQLNVPRATLTIPKVFLHLGPSNIPGAGIGAFTTLTLPSGVRFGPYRGRRVQQIKSEYCWQIYDSNKKPLQVIDGADVASSNWMRYVNCARHYHEQNLIAYQYQGDIYYRTIRIIPRATELLVFYGSEYANTLQIDLRKYNSKNYLAAIGVQHPTLKHNNKATIKEVSAETYFGGATTTILEISPTDVIYKKPDTSEHYNIEDDFQYVDGESSTTGDTQLTEDNQLMNVDFNFQKQCFDIEFHNSYKPNSEFDKTDHIKKQNHCNCKNVITSDKMVQVNFSLEEEESMKLCIQVSENAKKRRLGDYSGIKNEINDENSNNTFRSGFREVIIADKVSWDCNNCHKVLTSKTSLKRHALTHNEVKAYNCSECEYSTHFKNKLVQHISVHTGKNEHKCEICPFATNRQSNLQIHIQRMHLKEQPKCELCHYKTPKTSTMEHHKALHMKKNVFKCDFCDYLCSQRNKLPRHLSSVHNKR